MNKHNWIVLVVLCFSLSIFSSCSTTSQDIPERNQSESILQSENAKSERLTVQAPITPAPDAEESYHFFKELHPAKEFLDYNLLELGETDAGIDFFIMIDEKRIAATKSSDKYTTESVGIFNLESKQYEELYSFSDRKVFVAAVNDEYFILNSSADLGDSNQRHALRLKTKELIALPEVNEYYQSVLPFNKTLLDGHLFYYDDIRSPDNSTNQMFVDLFQYNLETSEIVLICENMQNPHLYNDRVVGFRQDETGKYTKLADVDMQFQMDLPYGLANIEILNKPSKAWVFALENDEQLRITTSFLFCLENVNNSRVLSSSETIGTLGISENFVSWMTFFDTIPYLYLIDKDIIVSFDDLPKLSSRFFCYKDCALLMFMNEKDETKTYYYVKAR